eukprot:scaffold297942_cov33-Tisochrysis_lutea.AAC.4
MHEPRKPSAGIAAGKFDAVHTPAGRSLQPGPSWCHHARSAPSQLSAASTACFTNGMASSLSNGSPETTQTVARTSWVHFRSANCRRRALQPAASLGTGSEKRSFATPASPAATPVALPSEVHKSPSGGRAQGTTAPCCNPNIHSSSLAATPASSPPAAIATYSTADTIAAAASQQSCYLGRSRIRRHFIL